tara:strand:- start:235 stop:789 length:555 start_codon:yes stop_codon:yes gene_type:complete
MRKVLVIGAGGIGSFLIPILARTKLYNITVADPDIVEKKNLPYQNYEEEDVGKNKAKVMYDRYICNGMKPHPILTDNQLKGYSLVISCVDNLSLRRTLYRSNINWLDLRAQGRNCAFISSDADPQQYDTLLAGPDGSFSCQGDSWDGSNKNVHFMQCAIAGIGAQWIQRYMNDEEVKNFGVFNI